jgi:hypothetical protein
MKRPMPAGSARASVELRKRKERTIASANKPNLLNPKAEHNGLDKHAGAEVPDRRRFAAAGYPSA